MEEMSVLVSKRTILFQTEATEMDLILIVSTLSGIVTTTGAAAFSHYEGQES
jgi:hypothetical protein